jgi:hypothetical protein
MRNPELRKIARDAKAAVAAGLAGFVLAGIAVWTAAADREAVIGGAICAGLGAVLFSSVIGVIGASVCSLRRAGFAGAIIFGLPATILIPLFPLAVREAIWLWAALCSFGSILAQVGALAGGNLAERSNSPERKQFTLLQMLAFFIPVAIFLGYVTHFKTQ